VLERFRVTCSGEVTLITGWFGLRFGVGTDAERLELFTITVSSDSDLLLAGEPTGFRGIITGLASGYGGVLCCSFGLVGLGLGGVEGSTKPPDARLLAASTPCWYANICSEVLPGCSNGHGSCADGICSTNLSPGVTVGLDAPLLAGDVVPEDCGTGDNIGV
jgi:hypothetical protein